MTNIGMVRSLVRCVVKCLVRCSSGTSPLFKGLSEDIGEMLVKRNPTPPPGLTPYPPASPPILRPHPLSPGLTPYPPLPLARGDAYGGEGS